MLRYFQQHFEKILLGISMVALILFGARSSARLNRLDEIAQRNPVLGVQPAPYEYERARIPNIGPVSWPAAPAQSSGPEWVYDVFTPPVIYYNPRTAEFTVTPPVINAPVPTRDDTPFELELVDVRQERYRIQLTGYVQDSRDGSYIALLQLLEQGGEIVRGRSGQAFEEHDFTLLSFQIRRLTTTSDSSMPVVEPVGIATIIDHRNGREETLTNREPKMLPRLQAVLRLRTVPPEEVVIREGGTVEVNGYGYLVTQLSLAPEQAVISRRPLDSLGASETRTLIPLPGADRLPAQGAPAPARSQPSQ